MKIHWISLIVLLSLAFDWLVASKQDVAKSPALPFASPTRKPI